MPSVKKRSIGKSSEVIVYSTPSCPYCKMAKEFLAQKKVPFKEIDVSEDQDAAFAMIKKSGQMGVPVIEIGNKIIVGFDKEAIAKAIK